MEAKKVQIILGQMQKNLECSICLEMMSNPVSTNCGHQFCRFCLMEFLERKRQVPCPLCKKIITKRSLTDRGQLDNIVSSIRQLISAFQTDTGVLFSPPRGSQANILPSTPEPASRHSDSRRSVRSRSMQQNEPKDIRQSSSGTDRNESTNGEGVKRRVGKRTKDNAQATPSRTVSKETDELLKCIAEGLHGAMETDSEASKDGYSESKNTGDNAVTESASKDLVTKALLEIIENGSHGAVLSNSEEMDENFDTCETPMDAESTAEKNIETVKTDKEGVLSKPEGVLSKPEGDVNDGQEEKIVLSGASNQQEAEIVASGTSRGNQQEVEIVASGTSSGDCYPLFRTPVEPSKCKGKTDKIDRPRRSCRAKDTNNQVSSGVCEDGKRPEIDDDTEFEYNDKSFVDQTKVQQTYTRKNRMNITKDKAGTKKVVEWLKNMPPCQSNGGVLEENIDRSKVPIKRTRKKAEKVLQEEGIMGQRIKHLAERVHNNNKELFFNVEDFANSPKQRESVTAVSEFIDAGKIKNGEIAVDLEQDSNEAEPCHDKTEDRTVNLTDQVNEVEVAVCKVDEPTKDEEELKQTIDTSANLNKNKMVLPLVASNEARAPPQRKRIFKSRGPVAVTEKVATTSEDKSKAHMNDTSVKDIRKESITESKVKCDTEMNSVSKEEEPGKVSDPFEFVSSQQTPVKSAKGKKNAKNKPKAAKSKKVPVCLPKTTSRIDCSKLKAIPKDTMNESKAAKKGKVSILKTASQIDIDKVSAKLEQAEDHDLLTCTQDAVAEFAVSEERSKAGNSKKKVSFREPIISDFIQEGRIDIIGYRNAKAEQEKGADKVLIDVTGSCEDAVSIEAKVASADKTNMVQDQQKEESEATANVKESHVEENSHQEDMEVDTGDNSDNESGDWRFDDGNSSGTDDLDIDPAPHEYEHPNLEIQSEEIRARLSQEMFEKTVLLKSQEPKAVSSPDPSIIGETPLVFTVPKFNKNLLDSRKKTESKRQSKTNVKNLVDCLKTQQVVPETPVLPYDSGGIASGESASLEVHHKFDTEQPDVSDTGTQQCLTEKVGESSEETQAPSLEIIEDTDMNVDKELELKHEEKGHVRGSNSSDLKSSESNHLTDSCSQKSDSILLSKSNNQNIQTKTQVVKRDSSKKESVESNSCDEVPPSVNTKTKVNRRSLSVTAGRKRKKGSTKHKHSEDDDTHAGDVDRLAGQDEALLNVSLEKQSKVAHKNTKTSVEKDPEIISQISLISVESVSQSSCNQKEVDIGVCEQDLNTLDKDKDMEVGKVDVCDSLEKIPGTGTYSVNIIPDSVVDTDFSDIPETNVIASLDIDKVENRDSENQEDIHDGQKLRRKLSNEVLSSKSNSQESNRHRNISGFLISPEVQCFSSPENIFGNDSEMPLVESSPFDETLQPVHLSDEELETQVDKSTVTIETQVDKSAVIIETQVDNYAVETQVDESQVDESAVAIETRVDKSAAAIVTQVDESAVTIDTQVDESAVAIETQVDEAAVAIETQIDQSAVAIETQVDESAVAIVDTENDVAAEQLDNKANANESFSNTSQNLGKKCALAKQKQREENSFATPSPQRKRRPTPSPRGSSKRQRLSVGMSSDLTASAGISPHSKMPDTPRAKLNQQIRSPATKYMSPKLMITRNLPLVSQSPNMLPFKGDLVHRSPLHGNKFGATSTPLKGAVLSPAVSCKYSPLQHTGRTDRQAERVGNTHEVEVVDVVVQGESGEENMHGIPTDLPDLHNPEAYDIVSSSESVKEMIVSSSECVKDMIVSSSECVKDMIVSSSGSVKEARKKRKNSPRLNIQPSKKRERESPVNKITVNSPKQLKIASQSEETVYEPEQDKDLNGSYASQEEMGGAIEGSKASADLNLDSSDEENIVESNKGTKTESKNKKQIMDESEDCPSSPEFNLDSSGEQDVQEQALKEINKFNEIKDSTESLIKMKSDTHNDIGFDTLPVSVGTNKKCITIEDEINNEYSTNLDSSPVQPDVILESDVESEGTGVEVLKAVSDSDSEDEVVRRKKVKKAVIESSSDEDDDDISRHMNLTSSSAFSSQSENLQTQERLALEKDLEKMEREMRAVKEQLRRSKKATTTGDESLPVTVDSDSDDAMIEADDTDDEMELFMSLPPVSPSNSLGVSDKGDNPTPQGNIENNTMNEKGDNCDKAESESEMETVPPSMTEELTDVEVDKRPVLADIDVNVTRSRTSPGKKKVLGFIATGLSVSQIHEVKKLAAVNDVKYYNRFNSSVSHVIVKADPEDTALCDRTLKFFQGVAHKCWIVNHLWVEDSRKVGHLLPEDVYEIQGDTATGEAHNGPRRSRLAKNKLFRDIDFSLIGDNTYLSKDSLRELIETCGGSVVDLEAHGKTQKHWFVISCTDMEEEGSEESNLINHQSKQLYRKHKVLTVTREWVLDSISLYKLKQLHDYLITNVKTAKIPNLTLLHNLL